MELRLEGFTNFLCILAHDGCLVFGGYRVLDDALYLAKGGSVFSDFGGEGGSEGLYRYLF